MTTMDENVNWMKLTYVLSIFSLHPRAPFCTYAFTSTFLIVLLYVPKREI